MEHGHPFGDLAGFWRGQGDGSYPTIDDFAYAEELMVEPVPGRPLAHWRSRTRDAASGEPRHAESGFLRATPGGIEFVVAHGFGLVETATGSMARRTLTLSSETLVSTPTAKRVDQVERRYQLDPIDDNVLSYTISMAAVGRDLTHHLKARLHRDDRG